MALIKSDHVQITKERGQLLRLAQAGPQSVTKFLAYLGVAGRQRAKLLRQFVGDDARQASRRPCGKCRVPIAPKLTPRQRLDRRLEFAVYLQMHRLLLTSKLPRGVIFDMNRMYKSVLRIDWKSFVINIFFFHENFERKFSYHFFFLQHFSIH